MFGGRKLCAFESAALVNPKRPVVVLVDSKSKMTELPQEWGNYYIGKKACWIACNAFNLLHK